MSNKNIVKQTAKELGMTYKELGDAIGYGEDAVKKASSSGVVSAPMLKAIELLLKTKQLEREIEVTSKLKELLKNFIN